jgi:t-SNARE complex subunit (syntaxin)
MQRLRRLQDPLISTRSLDLPLPVHTPGSLSAAAAVIPASQQQIATTGTTTSNLHGNNHKNATTVEDEAEDEAEDASLWSKEEEQVFALENQALANKLNTMATQVRTIEQRLAEIAALQDTLMIHVMEQEQQIETIYQEAMSTTENVRGANSQLESVIRRGVSFRLTMLLILLVLSFALLFIDWFGG